MTTPPKDGTPSCGQKNTCENITLPQTSFPGGNNYYWNSCDSMPPSPIFEYFFVLQLWYYKRYYRPFILIHCRWWTGELLGTNVTRQTLLILMRTTCIWCNDLSGRVQWSIRTKAMRSRQPCPFYVHVQPLDLFRKLCFLILDIAGLSSKWYTIAKKWAFQMTHMSSITQTELFIVMVLVTRWVALLIRSWIMFTVS